MNDVPIGNQQENLLWWLGGIIDGEGCITINHHTLHPTSPRRSLLFSPTIIIVNTNKSIIDTCISILTQNGLSHYVTFRPAKGNDKGKWSITIVGLKRASKALSTLSPYIIGKHAEARLVKQFCDLRLNATRTTTKTGGKGHPPYTETEFTIIEEVATIHNRNPQRLHAEIRDYKLRNKI